MSSKIQRSVQEIADRIAREKQEAEDKNQAPAEIASPVGYSVRGLWSCFADPGELTRGQAHTAMQLHLECGVDRCLVRWRARTALVEAGRMVLDSRATRVPVARSSWFMLLRVAVLGCGALFLGGRHAMR